MRTLGLIGLVLALVIVGFTMKKQLATVAPAPAVAPAAGDGSAPNVRAQSQQIQQQIVKHPLKWLEPNICPS